MAKRNTIGERFGLLVVKDEHRNEKGYPICLCQCDCGNEKEVHKSNLTGGRTKSCGCLEEKNRRKFNDLTGMQFERLTAIAPTDQRIDNNIVWECVCQCGNTVFVSGRSLTRKYTKSCGCHSEEKRDITNQRFGRLIALYPDESSRKRRIKWICRCDCGNTCSVNISNLRNGHTRSCGCLHDIEYRTLIDGTCLELIASTTIPKDNRSDIKGVSYYSKTDSWVATLAFKGRHYFLGKFDTIQEAAQARWQAEDDLVNPFIEEHRHLLKA